MKVLIWIVCMTVSVVMQLMLKYAGILGAIPVMIAFGSMLFTAKWLCKKWDKRKKRNKNEEVPQSDDNNNEETASSVAKENEEIPQSDGEKNEESTPSDDEVIEEIPVTQEEAPLIEKTAEESKTTSKSFCRKCGNEIDSKTKKCIGCGKQYFKGFKYYFSSIFTKKRTIPIILSFMLAVSIVCNIGQAVSNDDLVDRLIIQRNNAENMEDLYWESNSKLRFYEMYVVFVSSNDGTNLYHKYGCEDFDSSSFRAYNINLAKANGYVAHKKCCG